MAWTTKSSPPQSLPKVSKVAATDALSSTSQGTTSDAPSLVGQWLDPAPEGIALIGEGEFRPVFGQFPGDTPGDRMIVGNTHDKPALALHQSVHGGNPYAE